jgi:hypothetical protein
MNRDLCRAWLRAALAIAAAVAPPALFADCAELDDPTQILDFYLEIDPSDWDDVREHHGRDEEEEFVERPALFRCGDEAALPVMVRQKQGVGGPDREHPTNSPEKSTSTTAWRMANGTAAGKSSSRTVARRSSTPFSGKAWAGSSSRGPE